MDDAPTPYTPRIDDQIDLEDLWHELMGPLGFSSTSLWLLVIGTDDRPIPRITEIAEAHELPAAEEWTGFIEVLRRLADEVVPGGRLAFLRTRPGDDPVDDEDRRWALALYDAARAAGVPCETVHVANDVRLAPVPMDDLPLTRPA